MDKSHQTTARETRSGGDFNKAERDSLGVREGQGRSRRAARQAGEEAALQQASHAGNREPRTTTPTPSR